MTKEDFLGIDLIIPISLRRWKKEILKGSFKDVLREFSAVRKNLQVRHWNVIIETQGLIKSALVTAWAKQSSMRSFDQKATAEEGLKNKVKVVGLANKTEYSGYELRMNFFIDFQSLEKNFFFAKMGLRLLSQLDCETMPKYCPVINSFFGCHS